MLSEQLSLLLASHESNAIFCLLRTSNTSYHVHSHCQLKAPKLFPQSPCTVCIMWSSHVRKFTCTYCYIYNCFIYIFRCYLYCSYCFHCRPYKTSRSHSSHSLRYMYCASVQYLDLEVHVHVDLWICLILQNWTMQVVIVQLHLRQGWLRPLVNHQVLTTYVSVCTCTIVLYHSTVP